MFWLSSLFFFIIKRIKRLSIKCTTEFYFHVLYAISVFRKYFLPMEKILQEREGEKTDGNMNFMILRYLQGRFIDYVLFLHSKPAVLLSHFIYLLFKERETEREKKHFFLFECPLSQAITVLWIATFQYFLLILILNDRPLQ